MNTPDATHVHGPAASADDWWRAFNGAGELPYDSATRLVYLMLLAHADGPNRGETDKKGRPKRPLENAFPSVQTLVQRTALSHATVHRRLALLRRDGWIVVTAKGGGRKATTYALAVPRSTDTDDDSDDDPSPLSRRPQPSQSETPALSPCDPTDAVPTHDRRNSRSTAAAPRDEESATGEGEGSAAPVRRVQDFPDEPGVIRTEGDAFPDEVLQAVIDAGNAAKGDRWPLLALHDVIAPLHGEHFAEWLIDGPVHFKAGLEPYEASQKLRTLFNTAPKHGVFPENPPAPRNVARIDHTDREQAAERERFRRSIADAQADAPTEADATAEAEAHGYDEQAWVGHDLEARHREMERIRARSADEAARKRRLMGEPAPDTSQEPQEAR